MKVLVVEDDQHKMQQLLSALSELYPDCDPVIAESVRSGMDEVEKDKFDVVLLDMSLPTFDMGPKESGGRPQGLGGIELMRDMEREDREMPVVIITQWERFGKKPNEFGLPELAQRLRQEHPNMFMGLVYFSPSRGEWKKELGDCMSKALGADK